MKTINHITIILIATLLAGCSLNSRYYANSRKTDEALHILQRIESINSDVKTSKGTGWLTITDKKQQSKKFRMAWAASFPDKIRLTLLSAGHPLETIIADGKSVLFVSHTGRHNKKKISSSNPSLQDVVSIPIKLQDILSIFAGQVPIGKFDTAEIAQLTYASQLTDTMLILKRKWNNHSQNIVLTSDNRVANFSFLNDNGKLIHNLFNEQYKSFGSFSIPTKVKIKDNYGRQIYFDITSYQPNVEIKPEMFILTESR